MIDQDGLYVQYGCVKNYIFGFKNIYKEQFLYLRAIYFSEDSRKLLPLRFATTLLIFIRKKK
jgi:hypothetical protein